MPQSTPTVRVEAFSDGVFAIALTLLVLDFRIPKDIAPGTLGEALLAQWPELVAYLTSFITVAIIWMNHHFLFHMIASSNRNLMILNALLLLIVTFIPYPTSLIAEYFNSADRTLATLLYTGSYLLIAIIFNANWHYVSKNGLLLKESVTKKTIREVTFSNRIGLLAYGIAFLVAFRSAIVALCLCIVMAIYYALPKPAEPAS